MNVTVSVFGRFWAFYLAQQLQKENYLHTLISTYPQFEIAKYGIDSKFIRSVWYLDAIFRLWQKMPACVKSDRNPQLWFAEMFDQAASRVVPENSDLFVGWSSVSLNSLQRAKEFGATTILERGSSHMSYQTQILEEEYERCGKKFNGTHQGIYERELAEYELADKIAVPSLFVKQTFLDKGFPESKLIHVPFGTSLKEFYPVPKEDNVFRVIHCGAISIRKGVHYLLQAFHELNLPDAELWLVGTLDPEVEPFLTKYQSDRIILKGKQPQSELRWFYSQCSVFCLASIEEGLAMVQPQAMACGLPIIHTTNTGGEDIVRDGIDGFCIPICNVEAIKEKILFLYENSEIRSSMAKNALERACSSLSWDDYGQKVIQTYRTILDRN